MEYEMRFIVLFLAFFMYGCSAKAPVQSHDKFIKISSENVMVYLNNLKVKNDEVVSRFPDESGVLAIFVEEINHAIAELQVKKGIPAEDNIGRLAVAVTYNRHFSDVKGGIGMPSGSFSVVAFDQSDEQIWKYEREDVVITGRVFLSMIDIYKVPVGLFRQKEERKYLGIWAKEIAKIIYRQSQDHADRSRGA
jgi:hypothetical protein